MISRTGIFLLACLCAAQTQPLPLTLPAGAPALRPSWSTIRRGETFVPMTGDQRLHFLYRRLFLSPGTPLRIAVQAAFDQRANRPEEWGQGADAYGKRVLSRWGRSASRTGIETATAAALGYEQRYIRCNCDGVMRRTGHALAMTFVTYDRNGHWVPNVPRVGSTIAASFIARSWTPHESYTAGQNARSVTLPLLTASLVNVWREFSAPVTRRVKKKFKID